MDQKTAIYLENRRMHDQALLKMSFVALALIGAFLTAWRDFEIWIGAAFMLPSILYVITIVLVFWLFRLSSKIAFADDSARLRKRTGRVEIAAQSAFVAALVSALIVAALAFYYAPPPDDEDNPQCGSKETRLVTPGDPCV